MPIELFKSVKSKHAAKKEETHKTSSSSGDSTPKDSHHSQSELDLSLDETAEPKEYFADPASPTASSTFVTPQTSYESTLRSSNETPASDTPLTSTSSLGEQRSRSLRQALRGTLNRSRSQSRERGSEARSDSKDRKPGSRSGSPFRRREPKEFDPSKLTLDHAIGAGKGLSRIVGAGMKSPMDFTLGIARGFHNAPKLYGDDTVRPQAKVTDFQSGIKAATMVSSHTILAGNVHANKNRNLVTECMMGSQDWSPNQ